MVAQPIDRAQTLRWRTNWADVTPAANDDLTAGRICGVLNPHAALAKAGTPHELAQRISASLSSPTRACDITVASGDELEPALVEAARETDCLVVAGGDGSILTAAKVALAKGKPLMVVPMGTMNVLAHALGIPDGDAAAGLLGDGIVKTLDVGFVNGELFLNCVMIGPFADFTRARESIRASGELTHWGALLAESFTAIFKPHAYRYRLKGQGSLGWRKALALVVSNNPFSGEPFTFCPRESLTSGQLGLYVVRHRSFLRTLLHLILGYMGFESNDPALKVDLSEHLTVELDCPTTEALVDGEVVTLRSPLKFEIRRQALRVIVPR